MKQTSLIFITILLTNFAFAQGKSNSVTFSLESAQEVKNDMLRVDLYAHAKGDNATKIANQINQKVQRAFKIIEQHSSIKSKTGNYHINPRYKKSKIVSWEGKQYIHLQSSDMAKLGDLLQNLQSILQVSNMRFSISKPVFKAVKQELMLDLLSQFKQQAKLIASQIGAKTYKIISLNINDSHHFRGRRYEDSRQLAFSSASVAKTKVVAGSDEIKSKLNATIELIFD